MHFHWKKKENKNVVCYSFHQNFQGYVVRPIHIVKAIYITDMIITYDNSIVLLTCSKVDMSGVICSSVELAWLDITR